VNDWQEDAACNGVDTGVFVIDDKRHGRNGVYASPHTRIKLANALAICHSCPVQQQCRNYLGEWPDPPRGVVIAAMTPHQARLYWYTQHPGHTRRTA